MIKPTLPPPFSKPAEKSVEKSVESVKSLEKENKLKFLLKDKEDLGNKNYSEESSKSKLSSKSQKKTPGYWQNFRGYQSRPQKTNNLNHLESSRPKRR